MPPITMIPGGSGRHPDPAARLLALADRLEAAHEADPANAAVAKELRITLQALGAGGSGPQEDEVDRIRRQWQRGG